MTLTADTFTDLHRDVIVIRVHGRLDLRSAPVVRRVLLKAFADAPEAVIVNLADLQIAGPAALTVFPTAVRIHGDPSVALLLCDPAAALGPLLSTAVLGEIPIYATLRHAMAALAWTQARSARRVSTALASTSQAPAAARRLLATACADWGLVHLADPAMLIVSELVSNAVTHAVTHAGTHIHVSAALRGNYLHINVRDTDNTPIAPPAETEREAIGGRGLRLVDIYATAWGVKTSIAGKTVWATLRATPIRL